MIDSDTGLRGHVDHAQPRLAEQQQQEKGAFLQRLHDGAAAGRGAFDADRGDDDDRLVLQVEPHRLPDVRHRPSCSSSKQR